MKKTPTLLCSVLILCVLLLLACSVASAAEEEITIYKYISDFGEGTDGWFGRGGAAVSAKQGVLFTEARTEDWNSPGHVFPIKYGKKYRITVDVRQNKVKNAEFIVSAEQKKNGKVKYINIVRGMAAKGKWVTLTGIYTPDYYDDFVLYVETLGSATLPFEIRNFTVREAFDHVLIDGIEYDLDIDRSAEDFQKFCKMKCGETYEDDILSLTVTYLERNEHISLHAVPHKPGSTTIKTTKWTVLPRQEMPAELLGTWSYRYNKNDKAYYTFQEDGKVGFFSGGPHVDGYELLNYAYSNGVITISEQKKLGLCFEIKDDLPFPISKWNLEEKPKKLATGKVSRLKNVSIDYEYPNEMDNPGLILMDSTPDALDDMAISFPVKKNPDIPIDAFFKINISDPDILEVAGYKAWNIYLRGKKAGTAELSVELKQRNGKPNNPLKFTVAEGKKSLPDDLVGVCWVREGKQGERSVIFGQNGMLFIIGPDEPKSPFLAVGSFHYLYYDGYIMVGLDADGRDASCHWFHVEEQNGETVLYCYGYRNTSGIYTREPLKKGQAECLSGTYKFSEDGIPVRENKTSWDSLWWYYRDGGHASDGPIK